MIEGISPARTAKVPLPLLPASLLFAVLAVAGASTAAAIISDGTVELGVSDGGNLGASGVYSGGWTHRLAVLDSATDLDGAANGCSCEGWGIAYRSAVDVHGSCGGTGGCPEGHLGRPSFHDDGVNATSQATMRDLSIRHEFRPSGIAGIYRMEVEVVNVGSNPAYDVAYRRVIDWDTEPRPYREYITFGSNGTVPTEVVHWGDNGFMSADPHRDASFSRDCPANKLYSDCGPTDHGAAFEVLLGDMAPDRHRKAVWYIGVAPDETSALSSLSALDARLWSLAQSATNGTPVTWILAYGGDAGTNLPLAPQWEDAPCGSAYRLDMHGGSVAFPVVARSLDLEAVQLNATIPDGAAFSTTSGTTATGDFSWTAMPRHRGGHNASFVATDARGLSAPSCEVTFEVVHCRVEAPRYCEDADGDLVYDDADNCNEANSGQEDVDENGLGDVCEDADDDTWPDGMDNCRSTWNKDQADMDDDGVGDRCDDSDGDSRFDAEDNCPFTYNIPQWDWNNDGVGDACDDHDGDGVYDDVDNCMSTPNPDQGNWDGDWAGDACDDSDRDRITDDLDNCRTVANRDQADRDGDGIGDVCDDSDEDAVMDAYDNCPTRYNPGQHDRDGDGVGDACDAVIDDAPCDVVLWNDAAHVEPDGPLASGADTDCL